MATPRQSLTFGRGSTLVRVGEVGVVLDRAAKFGRKVFPLSAKLKSRSKLSVKIISVIAVVLVKWCSWSARDWKVLSREFDSNFCKFVSEKLSNSKCSVSAHFEKGIEGP